MRRTGLLIILTTLAAVTAPSLAAARTHVAVGLGDQSTAMFGAPAFRALGVRKTRYFIRWDAIHHNDVIAAADQFVDAGRNAGVKVLMHISTNDLRAKKAKLPSVAAYKRDVGRLVRHFRARGVTDWGAWNEANHKSQPTYRSPARAASFFKTMYALCKGCHIVALDALDQAGVERYIDAFYRALPSRYRKRAKVVGIHNYSDTNRTRSTGTRKIIREVKRFNRSTDFWLTETGGVVNFGGAFPCDQTRAAKRISYMFSLAKRYRHDVSRLYAYNWTGSDCNGFDAGLTNVDGSLRPGYSVFKSKIAGFTR